ncbi:hypothetical protein PN473_05285, partial [Dolichospermum circinale CS-545/17]|nr:hypothetical protein [Dolichospermum circinale CS-545/17]
TMGASGVNLQQILSTALSVSATVASTVASVGMGGDAAGLSANMQALTAMHRELYTSDPVYQKQADQIIGGILENRDKKDTRDKSIAKQFADAGIRTSVDGTLDELHKKMAGLKHPEDDVEIASLNAEIDAARKQQAQEWKQKAHDMGRTDLENIADKEMDARNKEFEESMKERQRLFDEMVKSMRRKGMSEKSIKDATIAHNEETVTLTKKHDIKGVKEDILEYKANLTKKEDKTVKTEMISRDSRVSSSDRSILSRAEDGNKNKINTLSDLAEKLAALNPSSDSLPITHADSEIGLVRHEPLKAAQKVAEGSGRTDLSENAKIQLEMIKADLSKSLPYKPENQQGSSSVESNTTLKLAHKEASAADRISPTTLAVNTQDGVRKDSAAPRIG